MSKRQRNILIISMVLGAVLFVGIALALKKKAGGVMILGVVGTVVGAGIGRVAGAE